jgi:hypothetical protein
MTESRDERRPREQGMALIMAILSLMLLTFLGLTLAATTSTELQIATNYRWSQQALYNAEAGLEAARIVLSRTAQLTTGWQLQLPAPRAASWTTAATSGPVAVAVGRDYEMSAAAISPADACDSSPSATARGGLGYGRVITENLGATRYENVSTFGGNTLNGAFTIWIRRPLSVDNAGNITDGASNNEAIITSEGVAPYSGASTAFTRAQQARRVLEARLDLAFGTVGSPCLGTQAGQEGGSPMGENFNPCAPITAGATGSLGGVFGGAGGGALTGTGVR